ncbi:MAG: YitT family protein [Clostridiaceae bacterium]|jgi:uncharacterized membrane-anchored protein YitT (DUF2179 family)|nr:YitT family protein [Clostridiaceae bacterium]
MEKKQKRNSSSKKEVNITGGGVRFPLTANERREWEVGEKFFGEADSYAEAENENFTDEMEKSAVSAVENNFRNGEISEDETVLFSPEAEILEEIAEYAGESDEYAEETEEEVLDESGDDIVERNPFLRNVKRYLSQGLIIIITGIIRALAMNVFIVPNKIAPGGISGIASILYNTLGWNVSLITIVFNVPLLILSFFYINRGFAISTTIATLVMSGFMEVLDTPSIPVFIEDPFAAAIMAGIMNGVALSLLLKINSSTGGSDIIALLVQNKFRNIKVIWLLFVLNAAVAIAAGITFASLSIVIFSLVTIYVGSFIAEMLQKGFVSTVEFKIFSDKKEEIADFVLHKLHHGITGLTGIGMYTGRQVNYLVCIINKRQENTLINFLKQTDPTAFYYISNVKSVIGSGFKNDVNPKSKIK